MGCQQTKCKRMFSVFSAVSMRGLAVGVWSVPACLRDPTIRSYRDQASYRRVTAWRHLPRGTPRQWRTASTPASQSFPAGRRGGNPGAAGYRNRKPEIVLENWENVRTKESIKREQALAWESRGLLMY